MSFASPVIPAEDSLSVFVDGSSLSGPRRGGVGIRYVYVDSVGNETTHDSYALGVAGATNNQMELLAITTALKDMQHPRFPLEMFEPATKIDIYTDSQYVANNLNNAIFGWPKQGWFTRDGRPVENTELWKDLVREFKKLNRVKRVDIKWAKGHASGNPHNKAADSLAKKSARRSLRPQLVPGTVRRKKTSQRTEVGSVRDFGLPVSIRIIGAEYMRMQKLNKYRYEVMSTDSEDHGRVDFAYSDDASYRPHHTYSVTLSEEDGMPTISESHGEVVESQDGDLHGTRDEADPSTEALRG